MDSYVAKEKRRQNRKNLIHVSTLAKENKPATF